MQRLVASLAVALVALAASGCTAEPSASGSASSAELAQPKPPVLPSGTFRAELNGTVEAIGRLTVDVIDTRSPDANERLDVLNKAGAACWFVGADTWRCSLMHPAESVPQSSLDKIAAANHDFFATFGEVTGKPSIATEGDSVVDWDVPQAGKTPAGEFELYTYRDMGDLKKLILPGNGSEKLELLVRDDGHLGRWNSTVVTESRWRFHEDMAVVVLAAQ